MDLGLRKIFFIICIYLVLLYIWHVDVRHDGQTVFGLLLQHITIVTLRV